LIRKYAGAARYLYNKTIEYLKQPNTSANWMKIKTQLINQAPDWTRDVPYQIKSIAIKDACTAVNNAKKKYRETKQMQEVKFRSCREKRDNIYIPKTAVKRNSVYINLLGDNLNAKEIIPIAEYDCRLLVDHSNYYLIIPVTTKGERKIKEFAMTNQIVALDPGVRTFQTFYSSNLAGKIGAKDFGRIHRICSHLDRLVSKISKAKNAKQRYSRRKAAKRIRETIQNLIAEIHWKTARFLCTNFKVIMIPKFETSQMVSKLASKTARAMLTWSHYRFRERLLHKAKELGVKVIIVDESYTSKTCSGCGKIHNIGSKSILSCDCGLSIDRDFNGARGIFLKNLSLALGDTPFSSFSSC
jgi:putative transposase